MNPKLRLLLYVVLLGCMAAFGTAFYKTYRAPRQPGSGSAPNSTNAAASLPPWAATNLATNVAGATNAIASTNKPAQATTPVPGAEDDDDGIRRRASGNLGRLTAYGIGMFFTLVGLSILIGHDVSRYLAHRVEDFIFNDNLDGVKDPEYEEAERVWASGRHLEAIQLMRDYLKRHPREQYVALRIAEIYETDLRNFLAAALEYQEVLKKRLPPERWGWAAIHLANLYSGKLNKTGEATALLRRIADEYGQTAAAKKARERLGLPEPVAAAPTPAPEPEPESPAKSEPPASNLPPGFRPKQ
jgi:TolA-binding protein